MENTFDIKALVRFLDCISDQRGEIRDSSYNHFILLLLHYIPRNFVDRAIAKYNEDWSRYMSEAEENLNTPFKQYHANKIPITSIIEVVKDDKIS